MVKWKSPIILQGLLQIFLWSASCGLKRWSAVQVRGVLSVILIFGPWLLCLFCLLPLPNQCCRFCPLSFLADFDLNLSIFALIHWWFIHIPYPPSRLSLLFAADFFLQQRFGKKVIWFDDYQIGNLSMILIGISDIP